MPQFMAIRDNQIDLEKGKGMVVRRAGFVFTGEKPPNKHYVPIKGDDVSKDLYDILSVQVKALGIEVQEQWSVMDLQHIITEHEKKKEKPALREKKIQALEEIGLTIHHKTGDKRIDELITEHQIEIK